MRKTIILTLVAAVLALSACSGQTQTRGSPTGAKPAASPSSAASSMAPTAPSTAGDMATFTSTSPAYSFQYPSSWKKEEGTSRTSPVTLRESAVSGGVALTLDKVPPGTTLATYRGVLRRQLVRRGFTVASTQPATMGEQPALVTRYTRVKWMIQFIYARFFTINGDYAYILTYGTADKYFDADYQTVASMVRSFRFGA